MTSGQCVMFAHNQCQYTLHPLLATVPNGQYAQVASFVTNNPAAMHSSSSSSGSNVYSSVATATMASQGLYSMPQYGTVRVIILRVKMLA